MFFLQLFDSLKQTSEEVVRRPTGSVSPCSEVPDNLAFTPVSCFYVNNLLQRRRTFALIMPEYIARQEFFLTVCIHKLVYGRMVLLGRGICGATFSAPPFIKTIYNSGSCLQFWVFVLCFRFVVSNLISERQLIYTPTWKKVKIYSICLLIYNSVSPKNSNISNKFKKLLNTISCLKFTYDLCCVPHIFVMCFFIMCWCTTKKWNTLLCITPESIYILL